MNADYDRRQYQRMLDLVLAYQKGAIGLAALVDNLDALRRALNSPSRVWLEQFEHLWGVLEDVYAVMLDNKETELRGVNSKLVNQSLNDLPALIQSAIDSLHES
ncbi:MAG: hypothetical protein OEY28_08965 [Nitrospira sp.]|nr:hypothetical protein [Nitrospira sp.]